DLRPSSYGGAVRLAGGVPVLLPVPPPGEYDVTAAATAVCARLDGLVSAAHGLDQRVQLLEQNSGSGATRDAIQAEIASQVAPLSQRLATAERSLEAIARVQNERQADARSAALTLALTNLKRAISDGRPFAAELAAVGNLSAAKLPVLQLSPYQDEGVLSIAQLQSEFAEASQKTIERHYSNKSKTFMGEVLSRAKSAIQVRPADSTGDTVEAILGRMSAPLWAGDLNGALIHGAALSDPPQEMKNWFGKAQARVAADDALRKTDQEILASLTKAAAPRH
ncbi:MAG: hypothetical protein HY765_08710, partial [Rhodomicrobium sp.]|nr:hypothetical protein [Rhodomicrobium sp.]